MQVWVLVPVLVPALVPRLVPALVWALVPASVQVPPADATNLRHSVRVDRREGRW